MAKTRTTHRPATPRQGATVAGLAVAGAALLGATAGIHARLYTTGYRDIPHIGALFLVNAVAASVLCLAVLLTRGRLRLLAAIGGAGLEWGTLAGLVITVQHGLFGFQDSTGAPLFWPSVVVEAMGGVVLAGMVAVAVTGLRQGVAGLDRSRR